MTKKPYLALGITHRCNYNCIYCNPVGENFGTEAKELPFSFWKDLIDVAYEVGIKTFRITGGEPLLRKDVIKILNYIDNLGDDVRINLCTNGVLLKQFVSDLISLRHLASIRVSLDTIDCLYDGYPKCLTKEKLDAIKNLHEKGIYIRVNTVVTRRTFNEIPKIITLCLVNNLDLKLLDLYYDFPNNREYWEENFIPLISIKNYIEQIGGKKKYYYNVDGGKGIPMYYYELDSIKIIFKDSLQGTHYHPLCKSCPEYPCQEGFYTPFVSSDGTLHPSHCLNPRFLVKMNNLTKDEIRTAMSFLLNEFEKSKHYSILPKPIQEKCTQSFLLLKELKPAKNHRFYFRQIEGKY